MSTPLQNYSALAGRLFLSVIFLISGVGKIENFSGTAAHMTAQGMPFSSVFLVGAIVLELLGALSLISGYKARYGAVMLIVFLVPTTLIFHAFWAVPKDMLKVQTIMFLKNLAIMGGLLTVVAHGPGKFSLQKTED